MTASDSPSGGTASNAAPWFEAIPERVLLAGVLVVAGLVYLPTLTFDFVYDDHWTLSANGFLRDPDLARLWSPDTRHIPDAFRPTLVTFDVWTVRWLGLTPMRHHAISVGLHVLVCWLLFRWLAVLRAPIVLRVAGVGLFGVMAIHAEAVAVVSYREDLLAAAFGFAALVLAQRWPHVRTGVARRTLGWIAIAGCMALACGAKMSAAPLVGVLVLAGVIAPWAAPQRGTLVMPTAAMTVGIGVAVIQTIIVQGGASPYASTDPRLMLTHAGSAATAAASVQNQLLMLTQLVAPLSLSPEYVDLPGRWTTAAPWLSLGALLGLLGWGVACHWRWRRPVVALSILGTAALMIPTSGLVALPNLRADRFMYLPSALACLGVAAGMLALGDYWVRRRGASRNSALALAPLIALAVVQGGLGQAAANTYRSDTRLWAIALRRAPHSPRAHAVMGQLLTRRAANQEHPDPWLVAQARAHCALALARDDGTALPLLCDARLAALERDWARAYRRFAEARPRAAVGEDRIVAGLASVALDRPGLPLAARIQESQDLLAWGMREFPYSSELQGVAAGIFHRLGEPERALAHYRRARSLRPERWDWVVAGLELQIDLGHPSAARLTWELYEPGLVTAVDLPTRKAARRRLKDAERLFGAHLP